MKKLVIYVLGGLAVGAVIGSIAALARRVFVDNT